MDRKNVLMRRRLEKLCSAVAVLIGMVKYILSKQLISANKAFAEGTFSKISVIVCTLVT